MKTQSPRAMPRRKFLRRAGALSTLACFGLRSTAQSTPAIQLVETKSISHEPEYYCRWPTVCRRRDGDLFLTCSERAVLRQARWRLAD